jgi:hypothetical protein
MTWELNITDELDIWLDKLAEEDGESYRKVLEAIEA